MLALVGLAAGCRTSAETSSAGPTTSGPSSSTTTPTTTTGEDTVGAPRSMSTKPSAPEAAPQRLPSGPITLITLGDSLTEGDGDEAEQGGYPGRLVRRLEDEGRAGSTLVNLGRSGWDSTQLIAGQEGAPEHPQLADALAAIRQAQAERRPPVVLLLVGSNDLWYLYANQADTTTEEEAEDLARYRANLERLVGDLTAAGAPVVVGINDDQSLRPVASDGALRADAFPDITDAEVRRMSAQARAYAGVVREVAAAHGALVADFLDAAFFRDRATLADDGNHPNHLGYDEMATIWLRAMRPLLG